MSSAVPKLDDGDMAAVAPAAERRAGALPAGVDVLDRVLEIRVADDVAAGRVGILEGLISSRDGEEPGLFPDAVVLRVIEILWFLRCRHNATRFLRPAGRSPLPIAPAGPNGAELEVKARAKMRRAADDRLTRRPWWIAVPASGYMRYWATPLIVSVQIGVVRLLRGEERVGEDHLL